MKVQVLHVRFQTGSLRGSAGRWKQWTPELHVTFETIRVQGSVILCTMRDDKLYTPRECGRVDVMRRVRGLSMLLRYLQNLRFVFSLLGRPKHVFRMLSFERVTQVKSPAHEKQPHILYYGRFISLMACNSSRLGSASWNESLIWVLFGPVARETGSGLTSFAKLRRWQIEKKSFVNSYYRTSQIRGFYQYKESWNSN